MAWMRLQISQHIKTAGMPVSVAANPLDCVVLGTAKRLEADSGFDTYVFRRGKRFR